MKRSLITVLVVLLSAAAALAQEDKPVSRQEMLRGSITPERAWWDVQHYDLSVQFMPDTRTIKGSNVITFKTLAPGRKMQIDLQTPLAITKVKHGAEEL